MKFSDKIKGWKPRFGNEIDITISGKIGLLRKKRVEYAKILEENQKIQKLLGEVRSLKKDIIYLMDKE